MPAKRQNTSVEEPSEAAKNAGQLSFARLAERRGQPDQAKAIYEAYVSKQPDNPLPFHRLGVMAARRGDFKKCDSYLAKAFHLDGDNPELLADIGYSMYLRGLTADAETFYRRALEIDRDHEAAANNLAMLLAETGRHTESLAIFRRVNDEAKAYANQGYVLAQTGELEEAKKYFNHALTLDPRLKQAATGMLQVAEYQKQVRTAPGFTRDRAPEQFAATTPTPSKPLPEAAVPEAVLSEIELPDVELTEVASAEVGPPEVALPNASLPEIVEPPTKKPSQMADLVVIRDKDRTLVATPPPAPRTAAELAALAPPPVMIADAEPAAAPQIPQVNLVSRRAQDVSVRDASQTSSIANSRRPQVIRPPMNDASPPPVFIQTATTSHAPPNTTFNPNSQSMQNASPPPVFIQPATTPSQARPITTYNPNARTMNEASPPPVFIQPATTPSQARPITSFNPNANDRAEPAAYPAGSVFTTRFSDIPAAMQTPSTQTVPESSMPTTQTGARERGGVTPAQPAAMNFGSPQPLQPWAGAATHWPEHIQAKN